MKTDKMIIIENGDARAQAEKLGMDMPARVIKHTKFMFYKKDIKRAWVDQDGSIMLVTDDGDYFEIAYDDKTWKELEVFFKKNEE